MSTAKKMLDHLRTEPAERLPKLRKLYRHDAVASKMIEEKITRRQPKGRKKPTP